MKYIIVANLQKAGKFMILKKDEVKRVAEETQRYLDRHIVDRLITRKDQTEPKSG